MLLKEFFNKLAEKRYRIIIVNSLFTVLLVLALFNILRLNSPQINIEGHQIYIAYLPVSFFIALTCVYGIQIIPALLVGVFIGFWLELHELHLNYIVAFYLTLSVIAPLWASVFLLKRRIGTRYRTNAANNKDVIKRLVYLGLLYPLIMQFMLYLVGFFINIQDDFQYYFSIREILLLLLNMQSLMLPAIIFTPFFYQLIRIFASPNYGKKIYFQHIVKIINDKDSLKGLVWTFCLALVLISHISLQNSAVLSSYTIPVIFLIFIYGFINLDTTIVTSLWSLTIFLVIKYDTMFVNLIQKDKLLICFSSLFMVFTIANRWLSIIHSKLKKLITKLYATTRRDPMSRLPNLQALSDELKKASAGESLCYIKLFAIERIEKHLGFAFKANISLFLYSHLKRLLGPEVRIFTTPNNDLLMLLPTRGIRHNLLWILTKINNIPVSDNNKSFDVLYGFSWVHTREIKDMYQTICGLEYLATSKGENNITALHENNELVARYTTLDIQRLAEIKEAINNGGIRIYTQKIQSMNGGHDYYEVLCRLEYNDEIIPPNDFLPIINEFELPVFFDFKVIEAFLIQYCLSFGNEHRTRYSLNIMPETLGDKNTADKIKNIFDKYSVNKKNMMFEVTEEQLFFNESAALENIKKLREAGFLIAIDDFGKGYANYERLKMLDADVLKIDGMFIKNLVHNKMDYVIVKSITEIAKMKGMQVVAEFVESREHVEILKHLHVDYLQGYFIGKPEPMSF